MTKKKNSLKSELVDFLLDDELPSEEETTAVNIRTENEESSDISKNQEDEATHLIFSKKDTANDTTAIVPKAKKQASSGTQYKTLPESAEAKVQQAQALQVAQDRINELETINAKLEFEISELRSSGEVLYKSNQELKSDIDKLKHKISDLEELNKSDKQFFEDKLYSKDKVLDKYKMKIESLELQLKVDFQKIRSRERELENRIEIMKKENQAVLRSKDDLILELKRNLDEINMEIESYKDKGRDLHMNHENAKEKMRKSVKAIRLALNLLETDEEESDAKDSKKESA